MIGSVVACVLFGFSPTFLAAVSLLFLWGIVDGNIGVVKTYLGEVVDDTNTVKGFALFGVIGGLGRFVGPIIGGYLSFPADNYSLFDGTVFDTFPLALSSSVVALSCFILLLPASRIQSTRGFASS